MTPTHDDRPETSEPFQTRSGGKVDDDVVVMRSEQIRPTRLSEDSKLESTHRIDSDSQRCKTLCLRFFIFVTFLRFLTFLVLAELGLFYFFCTFFSFNKCRVIRVRFGIQSNM